MREDKGIVEQLADRWMPGPLRPHWERLCNSSIGYRLAHGAFWSFIGTLVARGFSLVSFIVVARLLGKEAFGELSIIQSTVAMFQSFAGFGLGLTATKHVAEFKYTDPARTGRIIAFSSVIAMATGVLATICLAVLAPWLAARALASPQLSDLLRLGSIMLFLGAVSGAQAGALSGFEAFKHLSKVNFIAGLATLPLMVGGVLLGGVHGVVLGLIVSMGLNCLLNRRAIRIEAERIGVPLRYDGWMSEWRGVWKFSLMATLSGVVVTPATWACNAILVNQPGGYGELGVYNAVVKIKQVPEMILMTVLNPLLPMLSEQFARNDGEAYGKTLSAAYVISGLIMIPGAFLVIFVPGLALLPFGTSYAGNAGLVQWLFVHAIMVGLFSTLSNVLASTNTMGLGFAYNLAHALLLLAFSALIVPTRLGAGLAISLCLATVVAAVPCVVFIFRRYRHFLGSFPLGLMSSLFIPAGIGSLWVFTLLQTPAAVLVGMVMAILSVALLVRVSRHSLS